MPAVVSQNHPAHVDFRGRADEPLALAGRVRAEGREHRIAHLFDGRKRLGLVRAERRPLNELRVGENVPAPVEHERGRVGVGKGVSREVPRQLLDQHHLAEHADEAVVRPQRRIVQDRRLSQHVEPDGIAPGGGLGLLPGSHPPEEVRILRPVLGDRDPRVPVPRPAGPVGPEEGDPGDLGRGRQRAEHEGVQPGPVLDIELPVGDEGRDPARLLGDRLKAAGELPLQGIEHRVRPLLDEAPGALRRAPESEPQDDSDRGRDQHPEPEHRHRDNGNPPPPRGRPGRAPGHRFGPTRRGQRLDSARPARSDTIRAFRTGGRGISP